MKYKFALMVILIFSLNSCGIYFKYVKTEQINPVKLYNKNVGIVDIDVPVYLMEKSFTLKENLYNDLYSVLKRNKIRVVNIRRLKNEEVNNKLYKNDLYNWFFRSDSFKSGKREMEFDLTNIEYLMEVKILKFEAGTTLNNSWIKMVINIYNKDKFELVNIIKFEGFYKYIKKEMYRTLK